jgi:hypothetical protein
MDEEGSRSGAALSEEAQWGGLLYWGPWVINRRLWGWASLLMAAQTGNLEWACLPGTLRVG